MVKRNFFYFILIGFAASIAVVTIVTVTIVGGTNGDEITTGISIAKYLREIH